MTLPVKARSPVYLHGQLQARPSQRPIARPGPQPQPQRIMTAYNVALFAHITLVIVMFASLTADWLAIGGLRATDSAEAARAWIRVLQTSAAFGPWALHRPRRGPLPRRSRLVLARLDRRRAHRLDHLNAACLEVSNPGPITGSTSTSGGVNYPSKGGIS